MQAGFLAAPHPRLAAAACWSEPPPLRYVRITVPRPHAGADWRAVLRGLPLLPAARHRPGRHDGLRDRHRPAAAARLDDLGFRVDRLGGEDEPLTTDLYLLRDDRQRGSGFLAPDGNSADFFEAGPAPRPACSPPPTRACSSPSRPGGSVESHHFRGAQHGHNLKLVPSPHLLEAVRPKASPVAAVAAGAAADAIRSLSPTERRSSTRRSGRSTLAGDVERYSGARPADTAAP